MQLLDFLRFVLPRQGIKCAVEITPDGKTRQYFYDTHEELAAQIQAIDARGNAAYHACAVFKTKSRKASDALGAQCLWLDIDVGEDKAKKRKGYASTDIALEALGKFEEAYNLPAPTIVRSGYGLHVYWRLTAMASVEEWLRCAKLLKAVAERSGLLADESRTADLASILRPVGTFNRKHATPVPVFVEYDDCEPIAIAEFESLLALQVFPPMPAHVQAAGSIAQSLLGGAKPPVATPVTEGGRNNACARLAGALFAQRKTYEQVVNEVRLWNTKNEPPLDDAELVRTVESIYRKEQAKPPADMLPLPNPIPRPAMPQGYTAQPGGAMYMHYEDELGNAKTQCISAFECYLVDVCKRESEVKESYVFAASHPKDGWHLFAIGSGDFISPHGERIMKDNSTNIIHYKFFKKYVQEADAMMKKTRKDAIRYEQFGWKNNNQAFLVGNALIKRNGVVEYAYGDETLEKRMPGFKLADGSSLAAWRLQANKFFAPGFEAHGFGLITGFAAILMPFLLGASDGGTILALHTQASGFGKTNILQAISSIWGAYDATSVAGCDTENAKFGIIVKLKNLPVTEEEMGQRDPFVAAEIVKRFITGRDKNRAQRDGSVEFKNTRFQTTLISASNYSLAETLRLAGDAGATARVFEITVDAPTDREAFKEFTRIANAMQVNAGHAGRELVFKLLHEGVLEQVIEQLLETERLYWDILKTTGKDRYIAKQMAAAKIMSELLNQFEILSFNTARMLEWALAKALVRLDETATMPPSELLNQFILENGESCLVAQGPFNARKQNLIIQHPRNKLVMRLEQETSMLYIAQAAIRQWLMKTNQHYPTLAKDLLDRGVLVSDRRQVTLSAGANLPPARCLTWAVNMKHEDIAGIENLIPTTDERSAKPSILTLPISS